MIDYNGDTVYPIKFKDDIKYRKFKKNYSALNFITELIVDGEDLISYTPPHFYNSYRSKIMVAVGVYFNKKDKLLRFRIIKHKNGVRLKKFKITQDQYKQFYDMINTFTKIADNYKWQ